MEMEGVYLLILIDGVDNWEQNAIGKFPPGTDYGAGDGLVTIGQWASNPGWKYWDSGFGNDNDIIDDGDLVGQRDIHNSYW